MRKLLILCGTIWAVLALVVAVRAGEDVFPTPRAKDEPVPRKLPRAKDEPSDNSVTVTYEDVQSAPVYREPRIYVQPPSRSVHWNGTVCGPRG